MGTGETGERTTGKRSVIGSILGSILMAGLVTMAVELVVKVSAGPNSAGHALARTTEGAVALERPMKRSGTLVGYQIQF